MRTGQIQRLVFLAPWLRGNAQIGEEVDVAADVLVADPLSRGVDDVDEARVGGVEALGGVHGVEEGAARVQARDAGDFAWKPGRNFVY